MPVHFAGSSCNMQQIKKIAKKNKIKIIEDCSQAHGTYYNRKKLEVLEISHVFLFMQQNI